MKDLGLEVNLNSNIEIHKSCWASSCFSFFIVI